MPDYSKLIDADTWDFIRETEKWYPPDSTDQNITKHRQRYDMMCRAFFRGCPDSVSATDIVSGKVPLRIYRRKNSLQEATVLFCHGGSFMLGGLDSHDDICAEICDATGYDVVAVDYRLNPEFTHKDALNDVQLALDWIAQDRGGPVIGVGDSAGGFLIAGTVHSNRATGDIAGQVLIYPGLYFRTDGGSMDEHAFAPLLTKAEILSARSLPDEIEPQLPQIAVDLQNLPVTIAMSAQCDPIADDAQNYVKAINNAGGTAFWFEDKGLVHGHLRARHSVKRARVSFDRVLQAISLIGSGITVTRARLEN